MVVATSNEEGVAGWVRVSVFKRRWSARLWLVATFMRVSAIGQEISETNTPVQPQSWNWHVQNTIVVQYHPGFSAPYSGPNSMSSVNEVRESLSLDLYAGLRLWRGAEAHVDGLLWQGFGLSRTRGVEGFPNGEAFRLGTDVPNVNLARAFIRQSFPLGGESEAVEDRALYLRGTQAISRITVTIGKISVKDIFDNNAYANDPRTQFMNWALMANEAWDYPADSLGYTTGLAAELNQPQWAVRYGFFQMPRTSNGKVDLAQVCDLLETSGNDLMIMVELDPSPKMPLTPLECARINRTTMEKLGYTFRT